jgi:uncharacterized membrane protein
MPRKTGRKSTAVVPDAAKRVVNDVEKAGRSLPPEQRAAYRKAQRSVVSARRNAEAQEGRLRIN